MGRFKNIAGMQVAKSFEGVRANKAVRVELVERPFGSTVGIQFVRIFIAGKGVSTEQFSGSRLAMAEQTYAVAASMIAPAPAPKAEAPKVEKPKAAQPKERVVFELGNAQLVLVQGKVPTYEVRVNGKTEIERRAGLAWRAVEKELKTEVETLALA